jgi:hypothetical protein
MQVEKYGETFEAALTFVVGEDGEPFCPAREDGSLPP